MKKSSVVYLDAIKQKETKVTEMGEKPFQDFADKCFDAKNLRVVVIPKGHKCWDDSNGKSKAPIADTEQVVVFQGDSFYPWLRLSGKKFLALQSAASRDLAKAYAGYVEQEAKKSRQVVDSQRDTDAKESLPQCDFTSLSDAVNAFTAVGYSDEEAREMVKPLVLAGKVKIA